MKAEKLKSTALLCSLLLTLCGKSLTIEHVHFVQDFIQDSEMNEWTLGLGDGLSENDRDAIFEKKPNGLEFKAKSQIQGLVSFSSFEWTLLSTVIRRNLQPFSNENKVLCLKIRMKLDKMEHFDTISISLRDKNDEDSIQHNSDNYFLSYYNTAIKHNDKSDFRFAYGFFLNGHSVNMTKQFGLLNAREFVEHQFILRPDNSFSISIDNITLFEGSLDKAVNAKDAIANILRGNDFRFSSYNRNNYANIIEYKDDSWLPFVPQSYMRENICQLIVRLNSQNARVIIQYISVTTSDWQAGRATFPDQKPATMIRFSETFDDPEGHIQRWSASNNVKTSWHKPGILNLEAIGHKQLKKSINADVAEFKIANSNLNMKTTLQYKNSELTGSSFCISLSNLDKFDSRNYSLSYCIIIVDSGFRPILYIRHGTDLYLDLYLLSKRITTKSEINKPIEHAIWLKTDNSYILSIDGKVYSNDSLRNFIIINSKTSGKIDDIVLNSMRNQTMNKITITLKKWPEYASINIDNISVHTLELKEGLGDVPAHISPSFHDFESLSTHIDEFSTKNPELTTGNRTITTKEFQRTVKFSENFDPYSPDDYLYPWQQGKRVPGWQVDITASGRFEIGDGLIFIADEYADYGHLRMHRNIPQFSCTNKTLIVRFTAKFSHINGSAESRPKISSLCFQLSNGSVVSREIYNFNTHAFCVEDPVLMKLPSVFGMPAICPTGDCSSTFEPPITEYSIGPDKPKLYSFSLRPDNSYTITINNRLVYDSLLPQLTKLRGQMPSKKMPNSCQDVNFLTLSLRGTSVRLNDIVISTTD